MWGCSNPGTDLTLGINLMGVVGSDVAKVEQLSRILGVKYFESYQNFEVIRERHNR